MALPFQQLGKSVAPGRVGRLFALTTTAGMGAGRAADRRSAGDQHGIGTEGGHEQIL
jgi:hypothetical protein